MCGISIEIGKELFKKQNIFLDVHRGISENVIKVTDTQLAHQLLPTTTEDNNSTTQPVLIDKFTYLLFNGLIINTKKLSKKYNIIDFKSDTDFVAQLIKNHTYEALSDLRGSFAISVVYITKSKIISYRDHSGSRPLYYFIKNSSIKLHSDPRPLIKHFDIETGLLDEAFKIFGFVPEQILYSENIVGLRCIRPGHITILSVINDKWTIESEKFVQLSEFKVKPIKLVSKIIKSFSLGIEKQPSATFLSGGVDSSILAINLKNKKISSLTIASRKTNEIKRAENWSEILNIKNISKKFSKSEVNHINLKKQKILPFNSKDGSNILAISSLAQKHGFRIAFSGVGLDELTNGYNQIKKILIIHFLLLNSFTRLVALFLGFKFVSEELSNIQGSQYLKEHIISRLWSKKKPLTLKNLDMIKTILKENEYEIKSWFSENKVTNPSSQILLADFIFYTRNQLLRESDIIGYSMNIDIRAPFCEPNFFKTMINNKLKSKKIFIKFLKKNKWIEAPKEGFFFE